MEKRTNCFINLLKPSGMTSHDAVNAVRRIMSERKTGHLGTLDPGAAGVLPIACGPAAARLIEFLPEKTKGYRAEILLGKSSSSGDLYGDVEDRPVRTPPSEEDVRKALRDFEGRQTQRPPAASALKINGVPMYSYFRRGIDVDVPEREIEISSISLAKYAYPVMTIDVECSAGTYIRSLASDIGERLGCGGLMSYLIRYRSGSFLLRDSLTLEELSEVKDEIQLHSISPSEAMSSYVEIRADEALMSRVRCGNEFEWAGGSISEGEIARITDPDGDLAAVGEGVVRNGRIVVACRKVFADFPGKFPSQEGL